MVKIIKTKIKDLLIIKKETFKDKRGFLRELFRQNLLSKKFIFEIISNSKKNNFFLDLFKKKISRRSYLYRFYENNLINKYIKEIKK